MGWTDSHLHRFEKGGKQWGVPEPDGDDEIEIIDESRIIIGAVLTTPGNSIVVLVNPDRADRLRVVAHRSIAFRAHIHGPDRLTVGLLSEPCCTPVLEILALRHQIGVLQRSVKRPKLTPADRLLWAWLSTAWPDWKSVAFILKASTVVGWHRNGFRLFWTWKIRRGKQGRPAVPKEVRDLIRTMSLHNPLWGAPRIYGELLKVGIGIGETSVSQSGSAEETTVPDLEDVPRQSRGEYGVRGLLRRADGSVPDPVRVSGAGARAPTDRAFRIDGTSDSGVDRSTTARSLSLGCRTAISAERSRSDLRCGLRRPGEGHGHPASAFGPAVTLAARSSCASLTQTGTAKRHPGLPDLRADRVPAATGIFDRHRCP
jgi:hypothetical protein